MVKELITPFSAMKHFLSVDYMSFALALGASLLQPFDLTISAGRFLKWTSELASSFIQSLLTEVLLVYTFAFLPAVAFHVSSNSENLEEDKCGGDSNV